MNDLATTRIDPREESVFRRHSEMKLADQMVGLAEEISIACRRDSKPDKIRDRYERDDRN